LLSTGNVERGDTARETRLSDELSADGETVQRRALWVLVPEGQLFTGEDSLDGHSVEIRSD
jgi:hypothetical protein